MPVQFTSLMAEHHAVRQRVGLFDVSHMGEVVVQGPGAFDALQWIVTNDLAKLRDGTALYTVMCVESGGVVDDLIVYREAADRYFLCINASRRAEDVAHLQAQAERFDCTVTDVSDEWAQLALQGPRADDVLASLTSHDVRGMAPFTWADATVGGVAGVRIARTGYTGEPGFELYCRPAGAEQLFLAIEQAGAPHELALCGLGARDTLRLEMKYPLYGNDIDLEHDPIEAGLGWVVKLDKGSFLGSAALQRVKEQGPARKWVGFKMRDRGIPRHGYPIRAGGRDVGVVTSGTHSPSLNEPIGAGYVIAELASPGSTFDVIIRDKAIAAEVVKTPFYKRENR